MDDYILRSAELSDCGQYRYLLSRNWPMLLIQPKKTFALAFIMLNPSTADDKVDDPTIRRCMSFARREGYSGIHVVNLYAFRATDPKNITKIKDPERIGPANNFFIKQVVAECPEVVVAWGSHAFAQRRAKEVVKILSGVSIKCLGVNKDGSPKHPLFVPGNTQLIIWQLCDPRDAIL